MKFTIRFLLATSALLSVYTSSFALPITYSWDATNNGHFVEAVFDNGGVSNSMQTFDSDSFVSLSIFDELNNLLSSILVLEWKANFTTDASGFLTSGVSTFGDWGGSGSRAALIIRTSVGTGAWDFPSSWGLDRTYWKPKSQAGLVETSVPEPSIIALFGAGIVGLGFARRRKSRLA